VTGRALDHTTLSPDVLPYLDGAALRPATAIPDAVDPAARDVIHAWRRVAFAWQWDDPAANASALSVQMVTAGVPRPAMADPHAWQAEWANAPLDDGELLARWLGPVSALTIVSGPDGPRAVSGCADGRLRVWDLKKGTEDNPCQPAAGGGPVTAVSAAPDTSGLAVSGSQDGTLQIWNLMTGEPVGAPLAGHSGPVNAVSLLLVPDGRLLAVSGSSDCELRVWDVLNRCQLGPPLAGHDDTVLAVATYLDRDRHPFAVSASADGTLRIWTLGEEPDAAGPVLTGHRGQVLALAVGEADGRPIAVSGGDDDTLRVWDLAAGGPLGAPMAEHENWVSAVTLVDTAEGVRVVSGSYDRTIRVWDLRTRQQLSCFERDHSGPVTALETVRTRDGITLVETTRVTTSPRLTVSGSRDGTLRVWQLDGELPKLKLDDRPPGPSPSPRTVVAAADGDTAWAVTLGSEGCRLIDLDGRTPLPPLPSGDTPVSVAVASLPGRRPYLLAGYQDGALRASALPPPPATGDPAAPEPGDVPELTGTGQAVTALCAAITGAGIPLLVCGDRHGGMSVRNLETGAEWDPVPVLNGEGGLVRALACAALPGGHTVLLAAADKARIQAWNLASGDPWPVPRDHHDGLVTAVATVSLPDGQVLAVTGAADGTLCCWDLVTGGLLPIPAAAGPRHGHQEAVRAIVALPLHGERALVATGSDDRTIRVWDVATGQDAGFPVLQLSQSVRSIAADPRPGQLRLVVATMSGLFSVLLPERPR
jgi:WD40 repeat protein